MPKFIIIEGSPSDGFKFTGPFDTFDEADSWSQRHLHGDTTWISALEPTLYSEKKPHDPIIPPGMENTMLMIEEYNGAVRTLSILSADEFAKANAHDDEVSQQIASLLRREVKVLNLGGGAQPAMIVFLAKSL